MIKLQDDLEKFIEDVESELMDASRYPRDAHLLFSDYLEDLETTLNNFISAYIPFVLNYYGCIFYDYHARTAMFTDIENAREAKKYFPNWKILNIDVDSLENSEEVDGTSG